MTQQIIDRHIQSLRNVAQSLQTGVSGSVFDMPEGLNRDADSLSQYFTRDILFLSTGPDSLSHENDINFRIVHLYVISMVK